MRFMTLKGMCYKAGGYARRNDPHRREYYSGGSPHPGPTQTPASGQDVSPIGGCGVAIFMLGGLCALACPPLAVIFLLIGGLMAGGSAVASNHREQQHRTVSPPCNTPLQPRPPLRQISLPLASAPEFSKCHCQHCGQHLEYPAHGEGMTIACPTCQQDTTLNREDQTG